MGVWECMSSASESVKRNAPDTTTTLKNVYQYTSSAAETVKRNSPDTTSLKNAYHTTCSYGSAAFTKIGQAAWIFNPRCLMPDEEAKAKIATFATIFARNAGKYAAQEGFKLIPGGTAFSKIVSKTLDDVESEKRRALRATPPTGAEVRGGRGTEIANQTPEDVIRGFMTNEFFGNLMFDDLLVTELAKGKQRTETPHTSN